MKQVDNVVSLNADTGFHPNADAVLAMAVGRLDQVIVIGYQHGGTTIDDEYFATNIPEGDRVAWLLQRYLYQLMQHADESMED